MKSLFLAVSITISLAISSFGQATVGTVLPHKAVPGGLRLRVALDETVAVVVLDSRAPGSTKWKAAGKGTPNAAGSTQMVVEVPPALRGQELRVRVKSVRPAPKAVDFSRAKGRQSLRIAAGLAARAKVSAEFFDTSTRQWRRFAVAEAPEDTKKVWSMGIPPERRAARLRVVRLDARNPSSLSTRFPATFRTGATRFAGREIPARTAYPVYLAGSGMYADKTTSPAAPEVQESDIWKISDSRLFFFNQLRGLQVIETADPSDPKVISSLRMPAVGEDMYLLPGSRAVLLRRDWLNGGTTGIVLVDTSKAEAKILAELQIPGWYADSRIVNGRLVLLTSLYNYSSWQVSGSISVISDLTSLPKLESQATLDFSPSTLGVGSDYLWVSGSKNWAWNQSNIELYKLADLPAMGAPLRAELGGVVYDKFKVHQKGDKLFAITQKWGANWQQSTALESYSLDGDAPTLLQRLPLVEGESLHATRFDGNRAYVVTFQQIDPLWIIDLSNPASMQIEAELQVPGWSSYIQPVGNFLAAVGVESGKVTASLFNVEDPRSPFLSSRIEVGDGTYSWSEANWNEKAVAILPAADLILLPYSSFDSAGEASAVQLVDMDTTSGQLTKRGIIRHAFTPRRATQLREGILASLSNRELLLLDSGDRSSPALLSEVSLAFGADVIAGSRKGMLVHGESGDWSGSPAMLRVSTATDPDAVTAEAPLGEGEILAADLQDSHIVVLVRSRKDPAAGRLIRFDAAKLPLLLETGRCGVKIDNSWGTTANLVWPAEDVVVAAVRRSAWNWWRGPWDDAVVMPMAKKSAIMPGIWNPYPMQPDGAVLHAFDLSTGSPSLASSLDLASLSPRNVSPFFAADGLVVFSTDQTRQQKAASANKPAAPAVTALEFTGLRVVDYAHPAAPLLWPAADLPGRLEGIAEFDRSAGLVFAANPAGGLDALLYEGGAAQAVATLTGNATRSIYGRSVWSFTNGALSRSKLSDEAAWVAEGSRFDLPFSPTSLRAHAGGVVAGAGRDLASFPNDFSAEPKKFSIPGWWWSPELSKVSIGTDGLAVPVGQYGLEVLH